MSLDEVRDELAAADERMQALHGALGANHDAPFARTVGESMRDAQG